MSIWELLFEPFPKENQINGLTNELKGIYIYNIFQQKKESILVVTSSLYESNQMYQIIQNYTSKVLLFPMDDFLTSEALAISPEFKNTRLETIHELSKNIPHIVITNLMGYLRYIPTMTCFESHKLTLFKNQDYDMKKMVQQLSQMGYERETIVSKTGDIAIRGYVVDIFPIGEINPIRIEFWGDTIDSIRTFNIENQLKIEEIDQITIRSNTEALFDTEEDHPYHQLPQYQKVTNILGFISSQQVIFIDYQQLKNSYEALLDEIFNYNINLELPSDTPYMYELDKLSPKYEKYLENFDDQLNCVKSTITYHTKEIFDLFGKNKDWNSYLNKQLQANKQIIICFSTRYQMNHFMEEYNRDDYVVTNECEIFEHKINLIIHPIVSGFEMNQFIIIGEQDLSQKKKQSIQYKSNFKYGKIGRAHV